MPSCSLLSGFQCRICCCSGTAIVTAYVVCEGLGLESGVDKKSRGAVFLLGSIHSDRGGTAVVLIPKLSMVSSMIFSQVLNGILLPIVIVFMLLLINRKD